MAQPLDFVTVLNRVQQYISQRYSAALADKNKSAQLRTYIEKYIFDYDFTLDDAYDMAVSNLELYYSGTLTPEEEYTLVWNTEYPY